MWIKDHRISRVGRDLECWLTCELSSRCSPRPQHEVRAAARQPQGVLPRGPSSFSLPQLRPAAGGGGLLRRQGGPLRLILPSRQLLVLLIFNILSCFSCPPSRVHVAPHLSQPRRPVGCTVLEWLNKFFTKLNAAAYGGWWDGARLVGAAPDGAGRGGAFTGPRPVAAGPMAEPAQGTEPLWRTPPGRLAPPHVYRMAEALGAELRRLSGRFGPDAVAGLVPPVVRLLELLEALVAPVGSEGEALLAERQDEEVSGAVLGALGSRELFPVPPRAPSLREVLTSLPCPCGQVPRVALLPWRLSL